jgi:hypothetical protein
MLDTKYSKDEVRKIIIIAIKTGMLHAFKYGNISPGDICLDVLTDEVLAKHHY